ncbi:MAG: hypothetical protein OER88_10485, partial [Planctomycetota bacterium]|nr:hypothetical protein [Planctomycetota bacterium]
MLFKRRFWTGLRDGSITLAFRRWKRPTVRAGKTLQSPGGLLAIEEVAETALKSLRVADARAAGYESLAALKRELAGYRGTLYRVRFRNAGADPRAALRESTALSAAELSTLRRRLAHLDARSRSGAWVRPTLRLLRERPGVRAGDLGRELGLETLAFKRNVRKLKELGLTESLTVGYRLSPRGEA